MNHKKIHRKNMVDQYNLRYDANIFKHLLTWFKKLNISKQEVIENNIKSRRAKAKISLLAAISMGISMENYLDEDEHLLD